MLREGVDHKRIDGALFDAFGKNRADDLRTVESHAAAFVEWISETAIADPWRLKEIRHSLEAVHRAREATAVVRGAAGFALFADVVERASHEASGSYTADPATDRRARLVQRAQNLIDDAEVNDFARAWYDLPPDIPTAGAKLHAVGTTSFLLHCNPNEMNEGALKCLIPRYAHVRDVAEPFSEYCKTYGSVRERLGAEFDGAVPKIDPVTAGRYLWMDFVRGVTLAQALSAGGTETAPPERLAQLASLARRLARVLATLADIHKPHLDLSPSNIILSGDPLQPPNWSSPVLIDFGRNTLLSERVTVGSAYELAMSYISPEVQDAEREDRSLSDVYSLGMICLHVVTGEPPTAARRDALIEDVWELAPGVACLIEDMIDESPASRLALIPGSPSERLVALSESIVSEADQARERLESLRDAKPPFFFRPLPAPLERGATRLWREVRPPRPDVRELRKANGLRAWLLVQRAAWWAVAALTILLFSCQWSVLDKWKPIPAPVEKRLRDASILGSLHDQFPVRLLALTTGLIAFAYYEQIFATIRPLRIGGRRGLWLEAWTRGAVLVALALQFAGVLYPNPWAFLLTGIGGVLVSTNNWVWYRFVGDARDAATRHDFRRLARALTEFHANFKEWPQLMMLYSLGGVAVWLLLDRGWASDLWVYAIAMVLVNVLKLYQFNIVAYAPRVRANLARAVFTVERAEKSG